MDVTRDLLSGVSAGPRWDRRHDRRVGTDQGHAVDGPGACHPSWRVRHALRWRWRYPSVPFPAHAWAALC